jgi:hypothetical protein
MNMNDHQTWIVAAVVIVALIAAVAFVVREHRRRQSQHLQRRFGPEYARVLEAGGDRSKAEAELLAREKRVARLNIVPLAPAEAARFSEAWRVLQTRFVDNPRVTVAEADELVRDLMVKRGYPMADFEHRAADISVDHPQLVETYRAAQAIAVRDQRGEASTEELRKAVVYFRSLFDELLDVRSPSRPKAPAPSRVAAHP